MLELKDPKGGTINVPIALNSRRGRDYECNAITSMFGRRDKQTDKPVPMWFVDQAGVPGRLKYINIKKFSRWFDETGQALPGRGYSSERLFRILAEDGISVNTKKFSQWISQAGLVGSGGQSTKSLFNSVKTDADIVKSQNENPNSYQLGRATDTSLPPVDVAAIRARVKGAEVTELGGGRVRVAFPNGHTWLVDTRGGEIKPNAKSVRRDYGRDVEPEDVVLGRTRIIGGQTFIDIVGGMTDASTFSHEAFEAAWDLLTKEELHGSLTIGGLTLMQALEREVSKTSYQKLPEGEERMKELNAIIGKYRIKARNRLKREFPELVPKLMWQYTSPQSETDI